MRLTALRYTLRVIGVLSRYVARPDPVNARWYRARCAGEDLLIGEGISWLGPLSSLSLASFFRVGAAQINSNDSVLEMGAGAGVWSLCCLRRGARVSATDLPEVDLSGLAESAKRRGKDIEILSGDLFESLDQRQFDHVFFNPPFHVGTPSTPEERAYFGGVDGDVVCRYLTELSSYLTSQGVGWIVLPKRERALYQAHLDLFDVTEVSSRWLPLLGRVYLLALHQR